MDLNLDRVPATLDEAVEFLKEALSSADIREVRNPKYDAITAHFTWGQLIRNEWSLWEKDMRLVQHFKTNYGVDFADDISGMILDCLWQDLNNRPRRISELVKKYFKSDVSDS
jgi:hypothetical protein